MRTQAAHSSIQAERHRDYERRIMAARKGGYDVGSISARVLDQWHRMGWYDLFYQRQAVLYTSSVHH